MKEEEISRGKKNWKKLQQIILSKSLSHKLKDKKFQLFIKEVTPQEKTLLTSYTFKEFRFFQITPQPLYKELLHYRSDIDATGKWVWQAQEIAAYFLIKQVKEYKHKLKLCSQTNQSLRVLELGAGCSGLAAIAFSKVIEQMENIRVSELLITDGQQENIEFLQLNLEINKIQKGKALHMTWGNQEAIQNITLEPESRKVYQFVIICDCLYFTDFHSQLLLTIDSYLKQDGIALFVNPSRGQSMAQFLSLASLQNFQHELIDFDDELFTSEIKRIKEDVSCNLDKDIPYFIELRRRQNKISSK